MLSLILSPRALAAVWAGWSGITSVSYLGASPTALEPVTTIVPGSSLSAAWAVIAGLLLLGALLPPRPGPVGTVGRVARGVGITLVAAALAAWASTYFIDSVAHGGRMWVSGKNYAALALAAAASAALIARDKGPYIEEG